MHYLNMKSIVSETFANNVKKPKMNKGKEKKIINNDVKELNIISKISIKI